MSPKLHSRTIIKSTQGDPNLGFPVHRGKQRNSSPNGTLVGIINGVNINIDDTNFNHPQGFESIHMQYGDNKQMPISPKFKYTQYPQSKEKKPQTHILEQDKETKKYHFKQVD